MTTYDCTIDVLAHKTRVNFWMNWMGEVLQWRAEHHDESKLLPPEKEMFDEFTPKLKKYEFGSDEYKAALINMGDALKHHYEKNTHHPEHFKNGVDDMNLWDLVEMFCDWIAAASVKNSSMDLDYLQNRFSLSPQLRKLIENTLWWADRDCITNRVPLDYQPKTNFLKSGNSNDK